MAIRDLSLVLRPRFESAASDKAITRQATLLRSTQTTMERLNKTAAHGLKEQESLWKRLESAVTKCTSATLRGMDSALSGVNRFQRGLEGAVKGAVNLRNVILGSVVGAAAVRFGSNVLGQGASQVRNMRALNREFGPGLLFQGITGGARQIAGAAGLQEDDVIKGLLPVARAIRETKIGDSVGGRQIRSKRELEATQRAQFDVAASRFRTLATLNPEMGPEQIGFLLSEAGQGEEGLRGLAGALHLGRGSMADIKRDAKKKKQGIGDIVGTMFERAGYTGKAESAERSSFEFQFKAIRAKFEDTLGDVGAGAIERLNSRLGEGKSIADRFAEAIEKNRPLIDKMADGLANVIDRLVTMAEKLPAAFSWLQEHKTTLLSIAGAYAGLRVIGGARNLVGGALGGLGGTAGKLLGGATGTPVFVTNWPGGMSGGLPGVGGGDKGLGGVLKKAAAVTGVGLAAYELTTMLDDATGGRISSGAANAISAVSGQREKLKGIEDAGVAGHAAKLERIAVERRMRVAELEASGLTHGQAKYAADHPEEAEQMVAARKAGGDTNVSVSIGNVTTGVGQTPAQIARGLMPHIEEGLTRSIMAKAPAR